MWHCLHKNIKVYSFDYGLSKAMAMNILKITIFKKAKEIFSK